MKETISLQSNDTKELVIKLSKEGHSSRSIENITGISKSAINYFLSRETWKEWWDERDSFEDVGWGVPKPKVINPPQCKVLVLDIETSYMLLGGWGLFNQNYGLQQVIKDWDILSFSAKWLGSEENNYYDVVDYTERGLLGILHKLLSEADFVLGHNVKRFDLKKIRARMVVEGFAPYKNVRVLDTLEIAKQEFSFTSNKLDYLTNLLCKVSKKSSHAKFAGFLLWKEFLSGNVEAIEEMRGYCRMDVESVAELYLILAPWSNKLPNFDVYTDELLDMSEWVKDGYHYTNLGKYEQFVNVNTGQRKRGRVNLLSKEKRSQLLTNML